MKLYNFQFILFFLFLFVGCKEKKQEGITIIGEFPQSTQLDKGIPTKFNSLGFASLQIIDTCLLVFNRSGDNIFEVYSTISQKKIGAFGKKGRGPGEFAVPELTGEITIDKKTNRPLIHVYDLVLRRLNYVDLYASISDSQFISKYEVMPEVDLFIRRIIYKNDSLLYFMPENTGRMIIYNFKTKETLTTPFLPDIGIPIREENKWVAYHSVFTVDSKSKKIVAAPLLIGQVDFFDFNGIYLHSTNFDDFKKYENDLVTENLTKTSVKQYIVEMQKSDNSFFALNLNKSYKLIRESSIPGNSQILEFDWEGNPIHEYYLDRPVESFAYDELNNRLYVFNPHDMDQSIWYYELN